ncbi:MAG: hypothetical protein LC800_09195, partial [Acidobacteria bacterium]|nr:hypothetical protein [Acidobacteriota bacterium]
VKYIPILTQRPCGTCNSGWMSELEKLAMPILLPLFHGTRSTLDLREQTIVALWFFKTAVTYDLHSEIRAPRPAYFDEAECRQLKTTLSFNPSYMVYLGKYTGNRFFTIQEDHSGVSVVHRNNLQPTGDPVRAYALTLLIKHLVLQIFCTKADLTSVPFYKRDWSPFYVELAALPVSVRWPPLRNLNDALIEQFIFRWSESPPMPPP